MFEKQIIEIEKWKSVLWYIRV